MLLRPFKRIIGVFLFGIVTGIPHVDAQFEEKNFTRYAVRDGLSDNGISCLQQDEQGYLWIGTDAGLNRFDGNSFQKYYQGTPPLQLHSASVWNLKKFSRHRLGIISRGGFLLLDVNSYAIQDFAIPDSSALSTYINAVWDAEELPDGSFAITTAAGFYVFDVNGHLTVRRDVYQVSDIGKKRILYGRDIYKITNQQFLVYVEESGLASYEPEKQTFREFEPSDRSWAIFKNPDNFGYHYWVVKKQLNPREYIFIPDNEDSIVYYDHALNRKVVSALPFHVADALGWESRIELLNDSVMVMNDRNSGFFYLQLDQRTGQIRCDGKKYLPNYKIICLFADKDNRLWVGTTEGLLKQELHPPVIRAFRYPQNIGEKSSGGFTCTYRHGDILYAGRFSDYRGLAIIHAPDMQLIKEVSFFDGNRECNGVRSIEMYHPDTLWIGTDGGLLWYDIVSGRYGQVLDPVQYPWAVGFAPILAPPRDDGYAWMCSMLGGKVIRYHIPSRTYTVYTALTTPALPFDKVKSIVYDVYGDVWIGGHSLARWNNQLQDFDTLITVYGGPNKYSDNILALSADTEGSLWLHNANNGLLEYRIKEKKFVAYSMRDGLPSDVLQSLSPVIDHKLWMAGNNQLTLLDTRTKKFTVFDYEDGLPEAKPTSRRMFFDPASGQVYLGSDEYIVTFPLFPKKKPDNSSDLLLQAISLNNNRVLYQPTTALDLQYDENAISFYYTIIDFEKSNYQFAYRLNHSGDWTILGNQRTISLSNLSPGSYSLQLRASGKPGIEKTSEFFFVLHSPFWKTAWFVSLISVVLATGVYGLFRNRIKRIRQRANIDKLLSQTEMKALQAQMNPHFIFNSLNSIGEMILNNENKEASNYLSKFARLIRITLDQSSQSTVSLRNTVDYLERYMEMEHIRNNLFTHEIVIDQALDPDDTFLPPMLLQPFIENAIWHGVSAQRKGIHVRIEFTKDKEFLVCKIEDNGIGIFQAQQYRSENGGRHQPVGITNIQNRMNLLNEKYHLHGDVQILDKKEIPGSTETGTLVTLQLPLALEET